MDDDISNWPTVYDIWKDERRRVTKEDVAKGERCEAAIGFWRQWQTLIVELALKIGQGKIDLIEADNELRSHQFISTKADA